MITIRGLARSHCLIDTNVLLRLAQSAEAYPAQHAAVQRLIALGNRLYTTFQNVAEFWNVSTRPAQLNGRGLSSVEVQSSLLLLERQFEIITEDRDTYERWLALIVHFRVSGRQVHDARLIAHMLSRDIPYFLTSNIKDFTRYGDITAIDPQELA